MSGGESNQVGGMTLSGAYADVYDTDGTFSSEDKTVAMKTGNSEFAKKQQAMITACKADNVDFALNTWASGQQLPEGRMNNLVALANSMTVTDIEYLASTGKISPGDAGTLIALQGMSASMAPANTDALQHAMMNFTRLPSQDQAYVMSIMANHHTHYQLNLEDGDPVSGLILVHGNTTKEQQMATYYLATMGTDQPLNNFQDICRGRTAYGDAAAKLVYAMPDYQNMTMEERKALTDYLNEAAEYPMKDGKIVANPPPHEESLEDKLLNLSIAALYFLLTQNNIKVTGDVIRTKGVENYMHTQDYGDLVQAMAALTKNENPDADAKTQLNDITFTDHNGDEVNLVDWCEDHNIPIASNEISDDDQVYLDYMANPDDIPVPEEIEVASTTWGFMGNYAKTHKEYKGEHGEIAHNVLTWSDEQKADKKQEIEDKQWGLTSHQVDNIQTEMKNVATQTRDSTQLETNNISHETQNFQTYITQGFSIIDAMMSKMQEVARSAKVQG